ncbi:MAG: hypothetical protein WC956_11010 [bacterium]
MKDRLFHILFFGHRDPNIIAWWDDVLNATKVQSPAEIFDYDELKAIAREPLVLIGEQAEELRSQIERIDELVLSQNEQLRQRAQGFELQLTRFAPDAAALLSGRVTRSRKEKAQPLSEMELKRLYGDVGSNAARLRRYAVSLADTVQIDFLRAHFEDLANLLDKTAAGRNSNPFLARRRLFEIELMMADAVSLLKMPSEGFMREARAILKEIDDAKDGLAPDVRDTLEPLAVLISSGLESSGMYEAELRELVLEAYTLLFHHSPEGDLEDRGGEEARRVPLLRRIINAVGSDDNPAESGYEGRAKFRQVSNIVYGLIKSGDPKSAIIAARSMGLGDALVGAALLDASYRHWQGEGSFIYADVFSPLIRRTLMTDVGARSPAGPLMRHGSVVIEQLLPLVRIGTPMILEFSGGKNPSSIALALRHRGVAVASIDQNADPVMHEEWPENFVSIPGRPEEVAVLAAVFGPFAKQVVIVSPPPATTLPMVLAGLATLSTGGAMEIFNFRGRKDWLDSLPDAGFELSVSTLQPRHPLIPLGLDQTKETEMVRILASRTDNPPPGDEVDGGPEHGLIKVSGGGARVQTRKRPRRWSSTAEEVPKDPEASQSLEADTADEEALKMQLEDFAGYVPIASAALLVRG